MKATEIRNAIENKIKAIAKTEITFSIGRDLIALVVWDGDSKEPYERLRSVFGERAYDFDVDNEDGFDYAGCLINLNS